MWTTVSSGRSSRRGRIDWRIWRRGENDRPVASWNNDPKPPMWVKTADEILTSIGRYAGAVLQAAGPDQ